jgi:ubiquinone biosynthesis protein Coq4
MRLQQRLLKMKALWTFIKDPTRSEAIFEINEAFQSRWVVNVVHKLFIEKSSIAPLMRERYGPASLSNAELLKFPEGSLGFEYGKFLSENNLDPGFYPPLEVIDDKSYFRNRLRQTHDYWHLLTGFSTSYVDEAGLQAFYFAQIPHPFFALFTALLLVHSAINSPGETLTSLKTIAYGWRMGRGSSPFLAQKWEDQWAKPLAQLRRKLNLMGERFEAVLIAEQTSLNLK